MFLRNRLWLKVAAVFLPALIFVGLAEFYVINNMKQAEAFTLQYKYTQEGERKTFVLPDGTKVDMKGGTVIQYPTTFDGKERRLYLVGEAFFDIHHDSAKPFHVITPYFDITDIGTSFTVSSYMTTDEVYVYVKTGCVELYPEKGTHHIQALARRESFVQREERKRQRGQRTSKVSARMENGTDHH